MHFNINIKSKIYSIKDKLITFLLLSQILLFNQSTFAQSTTTSGPFSPSEGDLSVKMLSKLFGGLVGSGGADPLKDLILTFNGVILAVGGILVAYTIFAGTIGTAHDGKMLGKFSSVWVPIRTSIGAALVVPINGYCTMQMLVMWLILQGIGLADTVWSAALNGNAIMNGTISAFPESPNITELAKNILKASTCTIAAKKNNEDVLGITSENWGNYEVTLNKKNYIYFGAKNTIGSKDTCGKIALVDLDTTTKTPNSSSLGDFSGVADNMKNTGVADAIIKLQNQATRTMLSTLYSAANNFIEVKQEGEGKKVVSNVEAYNEEILSQAIQAYQTTIREGLTNHFAQNSKDNVLKTMDKDGWIMAGAWFVKQAQVMSQATVGLSTAPKATSGTLRKSYEYEDANSALNTVNERIETYSNPNNKLGTVSQLSSDADDDKSKKGSAWTRMKLNFGHWIGEFATGVDLKTIGQQTNVHPFIQMKQMGDQMITSAITGIVSITGLAAIVGLSQGSGIAAATVIAPITFTIFGGMMTLGFFLSYYIPMMPFLIWLGCLIGWFILVLEAIIAAPLWAIMHLHPNGDDVVGRGGQGYMLVLGLLLRPTLMIFGLICALVLSGVFGQFVNSIFYDVFVISRMGDGVGFIAVLLGYILYTTMMVTFVKKMFSIIHSIPDQLLSWIGGGGRQLGEYAGALTQGTEGEFMKAGGAMGAISGTSLNAGLGALQRTQAKGLQKSENEQKAAHNAGLDQSDVSGLAKRSGGLDSFGAISSVNNARSDLKAMGASESDLAQFNQSVLSAKDGNGDPESLDKSIASAKNDFMNEKFGSDAASMINSAGESNDKTPLNQQTAKSQNASKTASASNQQKVASLIADSFARMSPETFSSYISDMKTAANSDGNINNSQFNNPNVAAALASSDKFNDKNSFDNGKATGQGHSAIAAAVTSAYTKPQAAPTQTQEDNNTDE